jgi:FAD:protein FMN transferase
MIKKPGSVNRRAESDPRLGLSRCGIRQGRCDRMKRAGRFPAVLFILILLAACSRAPKEIEVIRSQEMMSTNVTITLTGTDETKLGGLADETFAFMRELSAKFNIYDPASEVSRMNAGGSGKPVRVSLELAEVLRAAATAHQNTDGYFDVTVRPLVLLWKEAKRTGTLPTEEQIQKAKSLVGFADISLSGDTVTFRKPGISVDLGGIAKGYVVHRATEHLKQRGVKAGIVDGGGDLYAWGKKPDGGKWRIGIQHPRDGKTVIKVLEIEDRAVLTSGDYERYFIRDGRRYSHIINPFSGMPDSDVVSITVVSPDLMSIDGLSAGLLAMGSARAAEKIALFRKTLPGTDFILIPMDGTGTP